METHNYRAIILGKYDLASFLKFWKRSWRFLPKKNLKNSNIFFFRYERNFYKNDFSFFQRVLENLAICQNGKNGGGVGFPPWRILLNPLQMFFFIGSGAWVTTAWTDCGECSDDGYNVITSTARECRDNNGDVLPASTISVLCPPETVEESECRVEKRCAPSKNPVCVN